MCLRCREWASLQPIRRNNDSKTGNGLYSTRMDTKKAKIHCELHLQMGRFCSFITVDYCCCYCVLQAWLPLATLTLTALGWFASMHVWYFCNVSNGPTSRPCLCMDEQSCAVIKSSLSHWCCRLNHCHQQKCVKVPVRHILPLLKCHFTFTFVSATCSVSPSAVPIRWLH